MKSARALRKLKQIQHVKAAIRFHERVIERKEADSKIYKEISRWQRGRVDTKKHRRENLHTARKNAREDWQLGPLRPNRAYGSEAKMYGALSLDELRGAQYPDHFLGGGDKIKSTIPKEIRQDMWGIVEGDRVVIMSGKDKGRIGIVQDLSKEGFEVTIKDLNKVWLDGRARQWQPGQERTPKQEISGLIPYDQVRLVTPQYVDTIHRGRIVRQLQDVIVEGIEVKRHTQGINPFTGEVQFAIPEEQQVDPNTEDVIYHRYVAGTNTPIKWPWDLEAEKEKLTQSPTFSKIATESDKGTVDRKTVFDRIRNSISWARKSNKADAANEGEAKEEEPVTQAEDLPSTNISTRPRAHDPQVHDEDTPKYIVDGERTTWVPSLVTPPFPESVVLELRTERKEREELDRKAAKYQQLVQERREKIREAKLKVQQEKEAEIASMKTPLRVKWELEQAMKKHKPQQYHPTGAPEVPSYLLRALGKHMAKNAQQVKS